MPLPRPPQPPPSSSPPVPLTVHATPIVTTNKQGRAPTMTWVHQRCPRRGEAGGAVGVGWGSLVVWWNLRGQERGCWACMGTLWVTVTSVRPHPPFSHPNRQGAVDAQKRKNVEAEALQGPCGQWSFMRLNLVIWVGVLMSADGASTFTTTSSSIAAVLTQSSAGGPTLPSRSTRPLSPRPSSHVLGLRGGEASMQGVEDWGSEDLCHKHNLSRLIADRVPREVKHARVRA